MVIGYEQHLGEKIIDSLPIGTIIQLILVISDEAVMPWAKLQD